jgi:hypothetical protein
MEKRTAALVGVMLVVVVGLSLVGCAGTPTATAPTKTMPEMLKESGFKAFPAGSEREKAHLQLCPKDTLMIHERPGTKCYAFSDPATKSMYVGDEAAYWRLQDSLDRQQQKIRQQRIESDPEFWNLWMDSQGGG